DLQGEEDLVGARALRAFIPFFDGAPRAELEGLQHGEVQAQSGGPVRVVGPEAVARVERVAAGPEAAAPRVERDEKLKVRGPGVVERLLTGPDRLDSRGLAGQDRVARGVGGKLGQG